MDQRWSSQVAPLSRPTLYTRLEWTRDAAHELKSGEGDWANHLEAVVEEVLFGEGDGVGQLGKRDAGV